MSTRGCIARVTPKGFSGRYHHYDSYPTGLGKALWHLCHGHFKGDHMAMLRLLINDHDAWLSITNSLPDKPCADFNLDIGYRNYVSEEADPEAHHLWAESPQCFCHGERSEKGWRITQDAIGGDIEFVYALDRKGRMHISSWLDGELTLFNIVDLAGAEPDWQAIEDHIDVAQGGITKAERMAQFEAERKAREAQAA